jgi:hypothetical protein
MAREIEILRDVILLGNMEPVEESSGLIAKREHIFSFSGEE